MTFKRNASGTMVDVAAVKRRASGVWADVGFVKRRSGGAWVTVWPIPLAVTANDVTDSALVTGSTYAVTVGTSTAVATGGAGTRSYAWAYVSGATFTVTNGSTSAATFRHVVPPSGSGSFVGTYSVTVSDSTGSTSHNVTVTLNYS